MDSDREFRQFSDQLRLQTASFSNLSLGDSIWSNQHVNTSQNLGISKNSDDWKLGVGGSGQKLAFANNKLDRYNNNNNNNNNTNFNSSEKSGSYFNRSNNNGEIKNYFDKAIRTQTAVNNVVGEKKNNNSANWKGNKKNNNYNNNINNKGNSNNGVEVDKRFKTLPPEESLPRNEAIGGYIFVCNNDTMEENLQRQLFGLPQRYRDSVRAITPGLPLFLYNYSNHQLHGIFEAASFGGTNIDPTAWEDKKKLGQSRFPAQVRVLTRKNCEPLEEDAFRPILHHYDGPKFRLELSVPEALDVLDKFAELNA